MELANRGYRWVPAGRGFYGSANGSAKHITFAHGAVQNPKLTPKRPQDDPK